MGLSSFLCFIPSLPFSTYAARNLLWDTHSPRKTPAGSLEAFDRVEDLVALGADV